MLKRPLNKRFSRDVLERRKTTTIRATAWPVGVPIMLYNWRALPYRSPQDDVAAVNVLRVTPIVISHVDSGEMIYSHNSNGECHALWATEGFSSAADMDSWFRPLLKRGEKMEQHLMTFELI